MLKSWDVFYLNSTVQPDGNSMYSVFEPDRVPVLLFFLILFVVLVLIFGGLQGLRGLLSLCWKFIGNYFYFASAYFAWIFSAFGEYRCFVR